MNIQENVKSVLKITEAVSFDLFLRLTGSLKGCSYETIQSTYMSGIARASG